MPSVKKSVIESIVERANAIDKVSRKKALEEADKLVLHTEAIKFVRSVLATLRKLK